jgi:hypothetical protein
VINKERHYIFLCSHTQHWYGTVPFSISLTSYQMLLYLSLRHSYMQWRSEPGYDRMTTVQGQRGQNEICSTSTDTSAARILPSTVTCAYATGTTLQHNLNSCTTQFLAVTRASGRHSSTEIPGIARQRVGRCGLSIPAWITQLLSFPKRPHRFWGPP